MESKTATADRARERAEWWEKDRKERLGEPVAERWYIQEYREAYNTGGYYDQDVPEKIVENSRTFDTREEAEVFLNSVVPAKGNKLRLKKQVCWEKHIPARVERKWIDTPFSS